MGIDGSEALIIESLVGVLDKTELGKKLAKPLDYLIIIICFAISIALFVGGIVILSTKLGQDSEARIGAYVMFGLGTGSLIYSCLHLKKSFKGKVKN